MYAGLTPFTKKDEIFKLFNLLEEPTYTVLENYLRTHNWNDELNRLKESRFIGVGVYRLLTKISIDYLDCSSTDLINFYNGCNRPEDEPHYEDIIVTFLMGIVTSLIAAMLYDQQKKVKIFQKTKIWNESNDEINYLFRGRWLRNMYSEKQISRKTHDDILFCLKNKYLVRNSATNESDPNIFPKIELEFQLRAKYHGLDLNQIEKSLINSLIEQTMKDIELEDFIEEFKDIIKKE